MKSKAELSLLASSIVLYLLSAVCYSYEAEGMAFSIDYPYRVCAFLLVGIASALLISGALLYIKRK